MSMPVDRDKVELLKPKAVSKLKKKKKKLTQAKKAVRAPVTPMKQAVKKDPLAEEVKVEIPEPRYEQIAFPEIQEGATKEEWMGIKAQYETKVRENQQEYNAAVKDWLREGSNGAIRRASV